MTEILNTDIYLIDQILKGRFDHYHKVIDLGCGSGRNLPYFLKNGFEVHGIDPNPAAIEEAKARAKMWNPKANLKLFKIRNIEKSGLRSQSYDLVICNAVLHFAQSEKHFEQMLLAACRLVRPGGYFFARLASDIGIEHLVKPLGNGRFLLPDESERYLVNQQQILAFTEKLNAQLAEPVKTTNVQNLRCMTTWCMLF